MWPDQADRFHRLRAAIGLAQRRRRPRCAPVDAVEDLGGDDRSGRRRRSSRRDQLVGAQLPLRGAATGVRHRARPDRCDCRSVVDLRRDAGTGERRAGCRTIPTGSSGPSSHWSVGATGCAPSSTRADCPPARLLDPLEGRTRPCDGTSWHPPAPRQVDRLADADSADRRRGAIGGGMPSSPIHTGAGATQVERRCGAGRAPNAWHSLPGPSASDRSARPGRRRSRMIVDARHRRHRPQQHGCAVTADAGDDVGAVVHAVGEVDVQMAGRPEHRPRCAASAAVRVARRIVGRVRLDLDDPPGAPAVRRAAC